MKRQPEALTDQPFDLLVLGGGITGAGVALDAVTRGFHVALIDKGDFAGGTSSASSKLVHGGLRYLERGDFSLVYEALQERRLLLNNAPHLVRPLRFVLPFYRGSRVPPWQWRVGLALYDLLAGSGNLHRNRSRRTPQILKEFPGLRAADLRDGAEYWDAQMDDSRLCVEVLKTAATAGACIANYVEAIAFERTDGPINGVRAVDRIGGQELSIRARVVLNATGPWVDTVCKLAGDDTGPHLQPTKGVHLLAADRGFKAAFLLLHPADGRVFFVIPWMGKTLIGTTDTFTPESPDELHVTRADVDYLLEAFNFYFQPGLAEGDLLGRFAGLRPLLHSKPGAPSAMTREFHVFTSASGLVSVAGGKYTTFRHMAEVITDVIARRLGRRRHCQTRGQRLDGAPLVPWREFAPREIAFLMSRYHLDDVAARHLVGRYGRRARDVAAYVEQDPSLAEPIFLGEPDLRAEIPYQREHEMALRPEDHLLRRTRLGLYCPGVMIDEATQKPR
jgi:glycerol-3-phosphate dehydrogenase